MGLNLKELVELALLDAVMDRPVALSGLIGATAPWHELSGRSDVKGLMGSMLHQLLDRKLFTVCEMNGRRPGAMLVGGEAAMLFERAAADMALMDMVQIRITPEGTECYRKLALRYYNG